MSRRPGGESSGGPRRKFPKFLQDADDLFFDFLSATDSLREMAADLANADDGPAPSQGAIDQELETATQVSKGSALHRPDIHGDGEVIRDGPVFRQALQMVQQQLAARIERLPESERPIRAAELRQKALSAGPAELAEMFGSLTNAWDTLIEIKMRTSRPDVLRRAVGAWLVAVVSEYERLVRDLVTLALSTLGDAIAPALDGFFDSQKLAIELGPPSELLEHTNTLDAIVAKVARFAQQGSDETIGIAEVVGDSLGFHVFPQPLTEIDRAGPHPPANGEYCPGIDPGFVDRLDFMCAAGTRPCARGIWDGLAGLRREAIHGPTRLGPSVAAHAIYQPGHAADRQLIVDFIGALGLRFGLMLMTEIAKRQPSRRPKRATVTELEVLQLKLGAEFRVITKALLEPREPRYALAWSLGELAMVLEGGREKAPMLALNCFFARQQLGKELGKPDRYIKKEEIERYDVAKKAGRYELLKRSLTGDSLGVYALLKRVVNEERNMTRNEVAEWPALDRLRKSRDYKRWLDGQATLERART